MSIRTEGFCGGSTSYVLEDCMEMAPKTLEELSKGVNQLLDEGEISNMIEDGFGVRTNYSNGFVGPNIVVFPSEDTTPSERVIVLSKERRCMRLRFNLERREVTTVEDHNFDKGYCNCIGDWIPYSIVEGVRTAKRKGALSWKILLP